MRLPGVPVRRCAVRSDPLHPRALFVAALLLLLSALARTRAQSALVLEAENLSPRGSGQAITTGADSAASGGVWVKIMADALEEWLEFTTPPIPAGDLSV